LLELYCEKVTSRLDILAEARFVVKYREIVIFTVRCCCSACPDEIKECVHTLLYCTPRLQVKEMHEVGALSILCNWLLIIMCGVWYLVLVSVVTQVW